MIAAWPKNTGKGSPSKRGLNQSAYFGDHVNPEIGKEDRKDHCRNENQSKKCHAVVVRCERGGRTLLFVFKSDVDAVPTIKDRIFPGSIVHADEASVWDELHSVFDTKRINNSVAFMNDGACTNHAECNFSRLRRVEIGTHHHASGRYLSAYSREAAWREDKRRQSNGALYMLVAAVTMVHPVSRGRGHGYWKRAPKLN